MGGHTDNQFGLPVLKSILFPFFIWDSSGLKENQTFYPMKLQTFFFSLRYRGYHTEFEKYCLYLWLTRKKMNFQNQMIGSGLIYFSLVFWPFGSSKSHVDIQSRVVFVCFMNNLTSSAPPLICREWEHWTQDTRNGLWSNHPIEGSCQITPWFLTTCYIFQQKPCPNTYQMISMCSLSRKYWCPSEWSFINPSSSMT